MEISTRVISYSRNTVSYPGQVPTITSPLPGNTGIMSEDDFRKVAEKGDAEVRAAQKIADAKKELEFLKRAGFPPKVLARLAAELLGRVQKAAGEFESAVGGTGATPSASGAADMGSAADAVAAASSSTSEGVASGQSADASAGDEAPLGSVEEKTARNAYQSVLEDAAKPEDLEESKLRSQFAALIAELKQLVKKGESEDRAAKPGR